MPATVFLDSVGNVVSTKPGSIWEPGWLRLTYAVLGLLVAAFAIAVSVGLFAQGARQRASAKGEGIGTALLNIFAKARTQSGGYLTHLGIGIILFGLVGSAMFVTDLQIPLDPTPGAQFQAGGYTFTYQGFDSQTLANNDVVTTFQLAVSKGGRDRGVLTPGQVQFYRQDTTKLNAAVLTEPLRDVFLVVQPGETGDLSANVKINPLISWVWVGFVLTILGSALAAWPKTSAVAAVPVAAAKGRS
jgi:cytochrome c-type biogenesis protein CcmF